MWAVRVPLQKILVVTGPNDPTRGGPIRRTDFRNGRRTERVQARTTAGRQAFETDRRSPFSSQSWPDPVTHRAAHRPPPNLEDAKSRDSIAFVDPSATFTT